MIDSGPARDEIGGSSIKACCTSTKGDEMR